VDRHRRGVDVHSERIPNRPKEHLFHFQYKYAIIFHWKFVGRKRSIARRTASDYFLSPSPIFYREAILQQSEASYTPQCDSAHTPEHEVLDTRPTVNFFPQSGGGIRTVIPERLPAHESVFAMTVFKCLGFEFNPILLMLSQCCRGNCVVLGFSECEKQAEVCVQGELPAAGKRNCTVRRSGLIDALSGKRQKPAA